MMTKKSNFLFLTLLIAGMCLGSCSYEDVLVTRSTNYYYYSHGERHSLPVNPDKRYVVVRENTAAETQIMPHSASTVYTAGEGMKGYIVDLTKLQSGSLADGATTGAKVAAALEALRADENIVAIEYVLEKEGDDPLPISNQFYVKLYKESDLSILQEEAEKIGCTVDFALKTSERWIQLSSSKKMNSLDASNYLFETGLFQDVDPGFLFTVEDI